MPRTHRYETHTTWTGDDGAGTATYRSYRRDHVTRADGRPDLPGSSDPAFRGDAGRWNPELLLVAALSQCHLLQYLHLCATHGVTVVGYEDAADGVMEEDGAGGGAFSQVTLRPVVTVARADMVEAADALHAQAAERCFVAASVRFPVGHEPEIRVAGAST